MCSSVSCQRAGRSVMLNRKKITNKSCFIKTFLLTHRWYVFCWLGNYGDSVEYRFNANRYINKQIIYYNANRNYFKSSRDPVITVTSVSNCEASTTASPCDGINHCGRGHWRRRTIHKVMQNKWRAVRITATTIIKWSFKMLCASSFTYSLQ